MNLIRKNREAKGWSQRLLAEKTHISQSDLSQFELGKREPWPAAHKRIARAFHKRIDEVFPEVE